ncbi:MAG: VWA domain-containing protein [Vicinamibacterales bacterium]
MKFKYGKYIPSLADDVDMEELVSALSEMLLSSGFQSPYGDGSIDGDRTMQALHDAILDALLNGGLLPDDVLEQLFGEQAETAKQQLDELVQQLMDRLQEAGYITPSPELQAERERRAQPGGGGEGGEGEQARATFEVTDKALDFLGYRALRDLLGSLGHASAGRHDTRDMATGVDASGAPKPYEFGDTLNLDASATMLNAVTRAYRSGDAGAKVAIGYEDLMVAQGEYQSSCATVIMLDCSHSMILYGEDRFTPAKRVAMALAQLIRTQYPGDTLHVVLFHDSAEEIPLRELGRVRVGPYYTNTREGLKMARRLLERQRKDMRQIIMITDGKPSAITQPDGRIYKNAFGLDPFVIRETFSEVSACAKAGILINTFMLARDYDLVAFVRRVASMCRGKAYFTTPHTLGQYVLMDYLDKKTRTIH